MTSLTSPPGGRLQYDFFWCHISAQSCGVSLLCRRVGVFVCEEYFSHLAPNERADPAPRSDSTWRVTADSAADSPGCHVDMGRSVMLPESLTDCFSWSSKSFDHDVPEPTVLQVLDEVLEPLQEGSAPGCGYRCVVEREALPWQQLPGSRCILGFSTPGRLSSSHLMILFGRGRT